MQCISLPCRILRTFVVVSRFSGFWFYFERRSENLSRLIRSSLLLGLKMEKRRILAILALVYASLPNKYPEQPPLRFPEILILICRLAAVETTRLVDLCFMEVSTLFTEWQKWVVRKASHLCIAFPPSLINLITADGRPLAPCFGETHFF